MSPYAAILTGSPNTFFLMHVDMIAVMILSNKIVLNDIKDNYALLEPSYGKKQMNILAN